MRMMLTAETDADTERWIGLIDRASFVTATVHTQNTAYLVVKRNDIVTVICPTGQAIQGELVLTDVMRVFSLRTGGATLLSTSSISRIRILEN